MHPKVKLVKLQTSNSNINILNLKQIIHIILRVIPRLYIAALNNLFTILSTFLTSWKVSSYWPPSSLTIVSVLVFFLCLFCFFKLVLTLWFWRKEVASFMVARLCKCLLLRVRLRLLQNALTVVVLLRASTHKHGQPCDSTTTDTPPTIVSHTLMEAISRKVQNWYKDHWKWKIIAVKDR